MNETPLSAPVLPTTQHAIQIVGPGQLVHNRAKPVPVPGPTQLVVKVEAVGICFSDTKLLNAFAAHPRKSDVLAGVDPAALAENPSYVSGDRPTVPGHECAGRIVAIGGDVRFHRLGERVLVQTDYRHLPTAGSNAAFGYNFEGGLQEYVLLDERMIIEPGTGERFLIPVDDKPAGSAVALLEPWACVEASYASRERATLAPGGRLLVVADTGHAIDGLAPLLTEVVPAAIVAVVQDDAQRLAIGAVADPSGPGVVFKDDLGTLPLGSFDDIVYFGANAEVIERLQVHLASRGVIDLVLGGRTIGGPVAVDVGRVHYDLTRWVGTPGRSAADGYASTPIDGDLRDGDRIAVIGAAGPMGFMHAVRAATCGRSGIAVVAIDIDDARLAHLAAIVAPLAEQHGVHFESINGATTDVEPGFSYVAVMVPAPALVVRAIELAGEGCRLNLFAGFPLGTRAGLDLDRLIAKRGYLLGTSGSDIADMKTVIGKLERGELDTNISVDAITGMEGVTEAFAAIEARTSGGKIVVYPGLHELGMVRLTELPGRFPSVAAGLQDGRWTRAAEEALLAVAADGGSR